MQQATVYFKGTFPVVSYIGKANELVSTINSLTNYDDGQGREYDILDEEL